MELDELNTSELVLLAQDNEPEAHRGLSREMLVSIVKGEEVDLPVRHVNKVRLKIMQFVNDHWIQMRAIVSCPAKSQDPRACFQCTDVQAVECALTNKQKIFGKD